MLPRLCRAGRRALGANQPADAGSGFTCSSVVAPVRAEARGDHRRNGSRATSLPVPRQRRSRLQARCFSPRAPSSLCPAANTSVRSLGQPTRRSVSRVRSKILGHGDPHESPTASVSPSTINWPAASPLISFVRRPAATAPIGNAEQRWRATPQRSAGGPGNPRVPTSNCHRALAAQSGGAARVPNRVPNSANLTSPSRT